MKLYIFIVTICIFFSCKALAAEKKPYVLVSIAPHKYVVEKIAGDTVQVGLLVPAGASAHTYEPTPKQMLMASQALVWFRIGEGFENRALQTLKGHNSQMVISDLRSGVSMIEGDTHSGCAHCHANGQDLHIWLSPRQLKIQAKTITDVLSERYPENKSKYTEAFLQFSQELDDLDQEIAAILRPLKGRLILVSHPAYAYFCRDYGLKQASIEFEGKDPTPQQMNKILNLARAANIKKIFIQAQYNNKGARLFAKELGAEVVMLDPYAENVKASMLEIAHNFANQ